MKDKSSNLSWKIIVIIIAIIIIISIIYFILGVGGVVISFIESPEDYAFEFIMLVILIFGPIIYFANSHRQEKIENSQKRQAFAGYILATYNSFNCYNRNFENEELPGHLNILKNWKNGKQYFRYPDDEKFFKIFVEFAERNELPTNTGSNWYKYKKYERCANLFLLNALISSYCFADCSAPCNKSDEELFLKLLDSCSFKEFQEDIQTMCLKSTREKIREKIWNETKEMM